MGAANSVQHLAWDLSSGECCGYWNCLVARETK